MIDEHENEHAEHGLEDLADMLAQADEAAAEKSREAAETLGPRHPRPEPGLPMAMAQAALAGMSVDQRLRLGSELWRVPHWRAGAAGRGQTMDEYLAWMERTTGPKARAAAILVALSDEKREAEARAKEGKEAEELRQALSASEGAGKAKDVRIGELERLVDKLFNRMRAMENAHAAALRNARKESA